MSTPPFGAAGFGIPSFDPTQWLSMFAAPQAAPAPPDPFAWWRGMAAAPAAAPASADPAALANQWMGQIQQLAAQFAGREAQPAEIVRTWRRLVGDNPFASTIASSAFMPMPLFGAPGAGRGPLDTPAFGYTREHQERMQAFARAGAEFQEASQAFQALVAEAGRDAFDRFESLLSQRTADAKPLETSRALFDLWIDAAEDAYADIALSERFQKAFGEYVNAQMRLRAATQKEIELMCAQWGIPGRAEVDAAHRKLAEVQREIRRLRRRMDEMASSAAAPAASAAPASQPEAAKAANPTAAKAGKPANVGKPTNATRAAEPAAKSRRKR